MKLASQKPGMHVAREFHNLDELPIRRFATDDDPSALQRLAEFGIELVTMAMPLAYLLSAVIDFMCERIFSQLARPSTKTHRAPQFLNVHQVAQLEDDGIGRVRVKLCRVRVLQAADVARVLDAGRLHSQTDSEVGRSRSSRVVDRLNHPRDAALAEAAGDEYGVEVA